MTTTTTDDEARRGGPRPRSRWTRLATMAAATLIAAALATAPALAGPGHGKHGKKKWKGHPGRGHGAPHARGYDHGHHGALMLHGPLHGPRARRVAPPVRGYVVAPRPVVVPRVIRGTAVRRYDPFFAGHAWYGPHRHEHAVYTFPVLVHGAVVGRPHAYCGDRLFTGHREVRRPRISIDLRF